MHALCAESYPSYAALTHAPVTGLRRLAPPEGTEGKGGKERTDGKECKEGQKGKEEGERVWEVQTPRGTVVARQIVLATNAYTGGLLDVGVVPVQAQAHLLAAPARPLPHSYSLRRSLAEFYSVAPRPDASVVLGVSRLGWPEALRDGAVGNVDDSGFNGVVARQGLDAVRDVWPDGPWADKTRNGEEAQRGEENREGEEEREGGSAPEGMQAAWTGIIGVTPDLVPVVGPVPGRDGLFVAAGFNGHGMARMFVTAPSLAHRVVHGEWASDDAMPECFRLTPERLERLRGEAS